MDFTINVKLELLNPLYHLTLVQCFMCIYEVYLQNLKKGLGCRGRLFLKIQTLINHCSIHRIGDEVSHFHMTKLFVRIR